MKKNVLFLLVIPVVLLTVNCCRREAQIECLKLSQSTLALIIDSTATLTAKILPEDAANCELLWKSYNEQVATVDNGKVTAKGVGMVEIDVSTKDGKYSTTCMVTVTHSLPIEPELVFVEGGTFLMGGFEEYVDPSELPQHSVTLSSFKIGKYEVTQKEWVAIMGDNPSLLQSNNYPVYGVSYNDIQKFLILLNNATGKNYRLPTEAQWEFAARGGNKSMGYIYSGSNNPNDVAWFWGNTHSQPNPVGKKAPNELGIYDMSGNVFEWTNDEYRDYTGNAQMDPSACASTESMNIVVRGGSCFLDKMFHGNKHYSRVTNRQITKPAFENNEELGFRLCLDE